MVIDEISTDEVLGTGFDERQAEDTVARFRDFLERHKDELAALQILYARPARAERLTHAASRNSPTGSPAPPARSTPSASGRPTAGWRPPASAATRCRRC
jgi:type I restriction enzyme R subunit